MGAPSVQELPGVQEPEIPVASTLTPQQAGQPTGGATSAQTDVLQTIRQEVASSLASLQEQSNAAISQMNSFYTDILAALERQRQDMIARSEAEQRQLDPGTLMALDQLKRDTEDALRAIKEEANRRGILDSGILISRQLEATGEMNRGEAQILSDRLTRIKNSLDASLAALDERAFQTRMQRAQAVPAAQQYWAGLYQNASQFGQGRIDQESQFGRSLAFQQEQAAAQNALAQQQMELQRRQANAGLALDLANTYGTYVYPTENWGLTFEQVEGRTPMNAQQLAAQQALGYQNQAGAQYQQDIQAQITDVKASMWAAFQGYNLDGTPRANGPMTLQEAWSILEAEVASGSMPPEVYQAAIEFLMQLYPNSQGLSYGGVTTP
ncbi:MAG: hypothetical protein C4521_10945 [Actinobacteria bacterium]|nr:MAG: hypothetical protein C4521_10945 [Actinomycetota bacterium]